jgi:DNA-binding beta-propeller fold protein YncE
MKRVVLLAGVLHAGCEAPCAAGRICEVMGAGELGFNGDGLPASQTRLASPTSVRVDPDGRPVVVDYSNMRVRVLDDDGTVQTLVGDGTHAFSEPGRDRLATPLENPVDAAWGPDGLLYVLAQHEGRVIRVDAGGVIELYAGTGALADGLGEVPKEQAEMGYGGGMAWAPDGSLYVSDLSFSRVRQITPEGVVKVVLGTGGAGLGELGYGPETAIAYPERLVVDAERGRLLVADTGNHRVLALDLASWQVELVAGAGQRGYAGDGGPAALALLSSPTGVEVLPDGGVLIADLNNDALRRVDAQGVIHTVAGDGGESPRRSGAPLSFTLARPAGLAWGADGELLIAERSGHRVLRWRGEGEAW